MTVPSQFTHASEPTVYLLSFPTLSVIGTGMFLTTPLLPLLQREFGVSVSRSGWLVLVYALDYALPALIAGPISNRLDRCKVLPVGLVGFGVFTAACGCTWGFWSFLAIRSLAGVATVFVVPQIWASIPVTAPLKAIVKTMGYVTAGLAIARVVGIPIASFLSSMGWCTPLFAIVASSVVLWTTLYKGFPNVASVASGGRLFTPYAYVACSRPLLMSLTIYLLFQTGSLTALSFIGSWLAEGSGADQNAIGTAMVTIGLGNAAGSLTGSRLVARPGERRSLLFGIITPGAICLGTVFVSNMWMAVIVLAVAMLVDGFLFPALMNELQSHTDLARGTVSSLASTAMYVGATIGGVIGGYPLSRFTGHSGVAVFAVAAYAASFGVYALGGAFKWDSEWGKCVVSNGVRRRPRMPVGVRRLRGTCDTTTFGILLKSFVDCEQAVSPGGVVGAWIVRETFARLPYP